MKRKDIVAIKFPVIGKYGLGCLDHVEVLAVTDTHFTAKLDGVVHKFLKDDFEVVDPYGSSPKTSVDIALSIFKAILEGNPVEAQTNTGNWRIVKNPELINVDRLIEVSHRVYVPPVRERRRITVDGVSYIEE